MNADETLIDSNILIYAHDESAGSKHDNARQIMLEGYEGKRALVFSTQNMGEFFTIATQKIKKPS